MKRIAYDDLVEIKLGSPEDFLKIKETLTRIGIESKRSKTLFQSCHILHRQGLYYIVHFKERFALDGRPYVFTEEDRARRNSIADMVAGWGLCTIVDPARIREPRAPAGSIKVLRWVDRGEWTLIPKYTRYPDARPSYPKKKGALTGSR